MTFEGLKLGGVKSIREKGLITRISGQQNYQ